MAVLTSGTALVQEDSSSGRLTSEIRLATMLRLITVWCQRLTCPHCHHIVMALNTHKTLVGVVIWIHHDADTWQPIESESKAKHATTLVRVVMLTYLQLQLAWLGQLLCCCWTCYSLRHALSGEMSMTADLFPQFLPENYTWVSNGEGRAMHAIVAFWTCFESSNHPFAAWWAPTVDLWIQFLFVVPAGQKAT